MMFAFHIRKHYQDKTKLMHYLCHHWDSTWLIIIIIKLNTIKAESCIFPLMGLNSRRMCHCMIYLRISKHLLHSTLSCVQSLRAHISKPISLIYLHFNHHLLCVFESACAQYPSHSHLRVSLMSSSWRMSCWDRAGSLETRAFMKLRMLYREIWKLKCSLWVATDRGTYCI